MSLRIQREMLCEKCLAKIRKLDYEYMREYRKAHKQKSYYKKVAGNKPIK